MVLKRHVDKKWERPFWGEKTAGGSAHDSHLGFKSHLYPYLYPYSYPYLHPYLYPYIFMMFFAGPGRFCRFSIVFHL